MIEVIQSIPVGIACTITSLMASKYWVKDTTRVQMVMLSADAALAKQSMYLFSSLRICMNFTSKF